MLDFLRQLYVLARPYRGRLALGILTGIICGLIEPLTLLTVLFVFKTIFPWANQAGAKPLPSWVPDAVKDWLQSAQDTLVQTGIQDQGHFGAVVALIALIPAVVFLRSLFDYLNVYFLQWTAVRAVMDLRVKLFAHLMNLSAGFFNANRSGELIARVMSDTATVQTCLSATTQSLIKDPVIVIGLIAVLLWRAPQLTLIFLLVIPTCVVPIAIFSRKIRRSAKAMQSQTAELTQVMNESFTGNRVVKAYNLEAIVIEQFRAATRRFISHFMRIVRAAEAPGPLLEFLGSVAIALIFIYLFLNRQEQRDPEKLSTVIASIFFMYKPLKNLTKLQTNLTQARAASERVFELLATPTTVPEPASPRPLNAAGAEIHFDHVDFSYGDNAVLRDIELRIKPGQLVALVGKTGSGKSTLANLLLRFYDPQRGAVRVGGVDLREVAAAELRKQIAVVSQEVVLFNDTIRRNIELGRPGATADEIVTAAKHANADEFITQRPEGYETIVGEKGVTLSGGQRQRLAIARAVLKNAPILILDEATSALDSESERAVQAALDGLMQGRTTICIAHRLSTIQRADQIVVLDAGRIAETGTHAELLERCGLYFKLHSLQFETGDAPSAPEAK
ncbi:MAG: ATP-binding cassette domain-containing protein [Pedosphaera sp.]|nr:ATP-binding cassette domain-containing protein [Pedosphaera sp.]